MSAARPFAHHLATAAIVVCGVMCLAFAPWQAAVTASAVLMLGVGGIGGRQLRAVSAIGFASWRSHVSSGIIVMASASTVALLYLSILAVDYGINQAFGGSAADHVAVVLRDGATSELTSTITIDEARSIDSFLSSALGVARSMRSLEILVIADVRSKTANRSTGQEVRGVTLPALSTTRPHLAMMKGRVPRSGVHELVIGSLVARQFDGDLLGSVLQVDAEDWTVVGTFQTGDGDDSTLLADVAQVASTYHRSTFQTMRFYFGNEEMLRDIESKLESDPVVSSFKIVDSKIYFKQKATTYLHSLHLIGYFCSAFLTLAVVMLSLNTSFASIYARAYEINILRVIGFKPWVIDLSATTLVWMLSVIGAAVAAAAVWYLLNDSIVSTVSGENARVSMRLHVNGQQILAAIMCSSAIGFVCGLLPARSITGARLKSDMRTIE